MKRWQSPRSATDVAARHFCTCCAEQWSGGTTLGLFWGGEHTLTAQDDREASLSALVLSRDDAPRCHVRSA